MTETEDLSKFPLPVIAKGLLKIEADRLAIPETETESLALSDEERRKAVGARIRIMRQLLGLTQADLAQKVGCSKQAINTYETGRREAGYRNLTALSKTLGVTVDWLFGLA